MRIGWIATIASLLLGGCAWIYNGTRDLTYDDFRKHNPQLIGKETVLFGVTTHRVDGRSQVDVWLSAGAKLHVFGPERQHLCVLAEDPAGKLVAMKSGSVVRLKGIIRADDTVAGGALQCPSHLILNATSVEALPDIR
jgi:hypothetical protein